MATLNICPHCDKERVSDGDWETCTACAPIIADFPSVDQIENDQARKVVVAAFKATQKLRCDFLCDQNWRVASQKDDCPKIDKEGLLTLPSWMKLRPKEMIEAENRLVEKALTVSPSIPRFGIEITKMDVYRDAKQYVERFEAFLLNQRRQALNI